MSKQPAVATVTTLKASVKESLSFIYYYLNIGVDHMYLYFDDPNDDVISQIEHIDRLTIIRCSESYWQNVGISPKSQVQQKQQYNATETFNMARSAGIEWLIHVDHDELIYGSESIHDYFKSIPDTVDVVNFPVMEAMPQKLNYENAISEIRYFKVYDALPSTFKQFSVNEKNSKLQHENSKWWFRKRKIARLFHSRHAKYNDGKNFLHGHQVGKSASRTSATIKSIGCHLPIPIENSSPELMISQSFYVLHYDCMGFDSWKNKWSTRLSGTSNFDTQQFSAYRNSILDQFEKHSRSDTLTNLYNKFYHLNSYEKVILLLTGLLKNIHHDPMLFNEPSSD